MSCLTMILGYYWDGHVSGSHMHGGGGNGWVYSWLFVVVV